MEGARGAEVQPPGEAGGPLVERGDAGVELGGDPGAHDRRRAAAGGQRRPVDLRGRADDLGVGAHEGAHERELLVRDLTVDHDDVGQLDLCAGHLADASVVVRAGVQVPLAQQVVAEQHAGEVRAAEGGDDGGELEVAGQTGVGLQGVGQLAGLGGGGQPGDDGAPAAVAAQALQRGQDVLAQRAAHAGVLELDVLLLQHPGGVADGPGEHLRVRVDAVPDDDGVGQVPGQAHQRGVHGHGVDPGHDEQRGPHAEPSLRAPAAP